mmetsp:Transcript_43418/g.140827  ORF Transcript_43418/g.140827 Transcript_43418/m.140827 type:complete len:213 (-) Transcript_43418:1361-1999(-)
MALAEVPLAQDVLPRVAAADGLARRVRHEMVEGAHVVQVVAGALPLPLAVVEVLVEAVEGRRPVVAALPLGGVIALATHGALDDHERERVVQVEDGVLVGDGGALEGAGDPELATVRVLSRVGRAARVLQPGSPPGALLGRVVGCIGVEGVAWSGDVVVPAATRLRVDGALTRVARRALARAHDAAVLPEARIEGPHPSVGGAGGDGLERGR